MSVRSLLEKEGDSEPIEAQKEEGPTLFGKKMKLPPILVTPKTRMKMTDASWVKRKKLKMRLIFSDSDSDSYSEFKPTYNDLQDSI